MKKTLACAALLALTGVANPTLAATQSLAGYGYDVSYDSEQLGASWSGQLSYDSLGRIAHLTFSNSASSTTDYFARSFSFSITPTQTTTVLSTEIVEIRSESGSEFFRNSLLSTTTGGALYAVRSNGTNTFPPSVAVPSAYGENNLAVTVESASAAVTRQNSFYYLDASGNTNTVHVNDPLPPNWAGGVIHQGDRFLYAGNVYVAKQDSGQFVPGIFAPNSILLAPYFDNLGPYSVSGGTLGETMTVSVSSEIWTPTFLQPGVHHCASIACMPPANGQYLPTSFDITLASTVTSEWVSEALPPVPEPESYAMLIAGLGVIGAIARRRQRAAAQ